MDIVIAQVAGIILNERQEAVHQISTTWLMLWRYITYALVVVNMQRRGIERNPTQLKRTSADAANVCGKV